MMRLGGGKQHGRYFMATSAIEPSAVQMLTELRIEDRRRGGAQIPIAPQQPSSAQMITTL
jgi:fructose-specific phosphotransferase system component IIB